MAEYPHNNGSPYISPIKSDGTILAIQNGKATLASSTTYLYPMGGQAATVESAHLQWDSALVAVISVEDCNFALDDVSLYSTTTGDWIHEDPTTAYIATTTTDVSVANATVTVAGGAAGGCMIHFGNTGGKRTRIKVVVTTGGVVRCGTHAKA